MDIVTVGIDLAKNVFALHGVGQSGKAVFIKPKVARTTFIALCGDTAPHSTTLAAFVSALGEEAVRLFAQVLYLCDRQGLISRETQSQARSALRQSASEEAGEVLQAARLHARSPDGHLHLPGRKAPLPQRDELPAQRLRCHEIHRDCLPCEQRKQCLRTPDKTKVRQVAFFRSKADDATESPCDRMKRAIDSETGRARYGQRFGTVEPVFGNLRHNKRLNRFTLRGREKVDTQWKLYCLMHNIEKLAHHGFGQ